MPLENEPTRPDFPPLNEMDDAETFDEDRSQVMSPGGKLTDEIREESPSLPEKPAEPTQEPSSVGNMRKRISKLTRQRSRAEDMLFEERTKRVDLERRLMEIENRMRYGQPQQAQSANTTMPSGYTYPYPAETAEPRQGPDSQAMAQHFYGMLHPLIERMDRQERRQALQTAHEAAWYDAEDSFPELALPNSELRQRTLQILQAQPQLQQMEQGPLLAAFIARGALADDAQPSVAKKIAAGTAAVAAPSGEEHNIAELRAEYERMRTNPRGLETADDRIRFRNLTRELRRLQRAREQPSV